VVKRLQQYGTWRSPLSPKSMPSKLRLYDVQWDDDGETLVWLEGRGKQGVLVAQQGLQAPRDLNTELSVRGGIGYGGGEFTVSQGRVLFAASDGRLYCQSLSEGLPRPITPAFGRLASPAVSPFGQWVVFVHHYEGVDGLAIVDTEGEHWPRKLAFQADFYMQPVWHPSGTRLAYITWNHPQMPWDGTELHLTTLEADASGMPQIASIEVIAGDEKTAILQPEFSPDGRMLSYISDASGWGHIYLYDLAERTHVQLTTGEVEHGAPAWVQGMRVYAWSHDSRWIYSIRNERGFNSLWKIDTRTHEATKVDELDDYTYLEQIAASPTRDAVALIAGSPTIPSRVITYEAQGPVAPPILSLEPDTPRGISVIIAEGRGLTVHRRSGSESLPASYLSVPEAIVWTGHDGETVHGLYYAPTNPEYEGTGKPPLVVYVHGGPTSQAQAGYSPVAQFFATRGFAVLEVNHRGSTGYGRAYQDKLRGAWGIYDVEDSASGAQALVDRGLVDPSRLVIMGGSAGGFTVLQSLIEKPHFYRAGICSYGISNQFMLIAESEFKFESRYSESLLGVLPDDAERYRERSPLFRADRIVDPVLIFQGTEDKVVPKEQSDLIVAALRARRVPHEYIVFEGEGHGWRKPETIEAYYEAILRFLNRYVLYS